MRLRAVSAAESASAPAAHKADLLADRPLALAEVVLVAMMNREWRSVLVVLLMVIAAVGWVAFVVLP
jgi:predicted exporter